MDLASLRDRLVAQKLSDSCGFAVWCRLYIGVVLLISFSDLDISIDSKVY